MEERMKRLGALYENEELFNVYVGGIISSDYVSADELDEKAEKAAELLTFLEIQPESEKRAMYLELIKRTADILKKEKNARV